MTQDLRRRDTRSTVAWLNFSHLRNNPDQNARQLDDVNCGQRAHVHDVHHRVWIPNFGGHLQLADRVPGLGAPLGIHVNHNTLHQARCVTQFAMRHANVIGPIVPCWAW